MDYQSKYFKYKLKYIKLQKFISDQNGGVILNKNQVQNKNQIQNRSRARFHYQRRLFQEENRKYP